MNAFSAKRTPRRSSARKRSNTPSAAFLFVRLRRVAPQPVHHAGLGRAERQPIGASLLKRNKESAHSFQCLPMQLVTALELRLESELSAQRSVHATFSPKRDVRLRSYAVTEVEHAKILQ